ncbi:hypothetical protein O3M35_006691 [Rhynocoris fuscipes]|uniref:C2H2-type domain-containing protein n=1 Tax=Rhynocoris fuscipes TaxID=488301 RepID=A0AAW1DEM4_9HEMI
MINCESEDSESKSCFFRKCACARVSISSDSLRSYSIESYRPTICPVLDCGGLFSPSTMLSHFLYTHRDITTEDLDINLGSVSTNITLQYHQLKPMKSTVVKTILLQGFKYEAIPVLLNMYLLPTIKYKVDDGSKIKHKGNWLLIWLSSLCTFPFAFWITIQTYGLPKLSFTQLCSPISLHEENCINREMSSPLLDSRIILMNVEYIKKIMKHENGLYVEIAIKNYEK